MASSSRSVSNGKQSPPAIPTENQAERGEALLPASAPGTTKLDDTVLPLSFNSTELHQELPLNLVLLAIASGDDLLARSLIDRLDANDGLVAAGFLAQDSAGNGLLQIAALGGHTKVIELLLQKGIDINSIDRNHGTALQAAIYMGCWEAVQLLLKSTALNVDTKGGYYGCALQVAAFRGKSDLVLELVSKYQADVNISGGKYGFPLQAAVQTGQMAVVKPILSQETIKINAKGGVYGSALQAAAQGSCRSRKLLAELSMGHESRQDAKDSSGNCIPFESGHSEHDYLEVAEALFNRGAQMDGGSGMFENPINAAVCSGSGKMLQLMLENLDRRFSDWKEDKSEVLAKALLIAITQSQENQLELVAMLISTGVTIDHHFSLPNLPTEVGAAKKSHEAESKDERLPDTMGIHGTFLRAAIAAGNEAVVNCLIDHQAKQSGIQKYSRSVKTRYEWTIGDAEYGNVLQLAVSRALLTSVALLLDYGADPNTPDTSQRTALHIACWFGFPAIVNLLLRNGVDINAKDERGATALDQAQNSLERSPRISGNDADFYNIIQTLQSNFDSFNPETPEMIICGPKRIFPWSRNQSRAARSVFTLPSWVTGLGFRATIVDIWEREDQEILYLKQPTVDDLLFKRRALYAATPAVDKPNIGQEKVRWIHLPVNNMTWAEMVITKILAQKQQASENVWGDMSLDISPPPRFIPPQCGRLKKNDSSILEDQQHSSSLFLSMPYMHWETDKSQRNVRQMVKEVKEEWLKTFNGARQQWPSERHSQQQPSAPTYNYVNHFRAFQDGDPVHDNGSGENYSNLFMKYLGEPRPVHLRRSLDQYYYSYVGDSGLGDEEQLIMKQFNEDMKHLRLISNREYQHLTHMIEKAQATPSSTLWERIFTKVMKSRRKELATAKERLQELIEAPFRDDNSPVIMVDQLWLWIIDKSTIVTCFPHRQYDRNAGDLDAADRTDIFKNILSYIRSRRRTNINTSHDLAELILSQCIGILNQADMHPELDFLRTYSIKSTQCKQTLIRDFLGGYDVLRMLNKFVQEFEKFEIWIHGQAPESEEAIQTFERLSNVIDQTHLLGQIQGISKERLEMFKTIFDDQIQVLVAASEEFERDNMVDQKFSRQKTSKSLADQSIKNVKLVQRMQSQAEQSYDTLKYLLNLKQQLATVMEARFSRNQAISSERQSKTIMVFTIVTIVFLPLTFVTTIFTLPVAEFQRVVVPEGSEFPPTAFLRKSYILPYMIGITFAVAVPCILAAFEIQSMQNALTKGWKKITGESKDEKSKKRKEGAEDDAVLSFRDRIY